MPDLLALVKLVGAPWLLWVAILIVFISSAARVGSEMSDTVAKIFGPVGRHWQKRRDARIDQAAAAEDLRAQLIKVAAERDKAYDEALNLRRDLGYLRDQRDNNAWTRDQERQIQELTKSVTYLRNRGEMNDAYLRQDADYHRWDALGRLGDPPEYVSYVEFERRWIVSHGPFDMTTNER